MLPLQNKKLLAIICIIVFIVVGVGVDSAFYSISRRVYYQYEGVRLLLIFLVPFLASAAAYILLSKDKSLLSSRGDIRFFALFFGIGLLIVFVLNFFDI